MIKILIHGIDPYLLYCIIGNTGSNLMTYLYWIGHWIHLFTNSTYLQFIIEYQRTRLSHVISNQSVEKSMLSESSYWEIDFNVTTEYLIG